MRGKIKMIFFLLLSILFVYIKLKPLKYLLDKENILTCADCFLYARYTEELKEGIYSGIDLLRNLPDFMPYPKPPPLISVIPAVLSGIFGVEIKTLFLYLPPLMSLLFAIPLYLWVRNFAPLPVALGGITLGAFGYGYYVRATVGRFDTDFMILFFIFLIILLLDLAISKKSYGGWMYLGLSLVSFYVFMWWYYKPFISIFFLAGLVILLIYQYFKREDYKDTLFKTLLFTMGVSHFIIQSDLTQYIVRLFPSVQQTVPVSKYIVELQPLSLQGLVNFTTDNFPVLVISAIGFLLLTFRNFRYLSIALPFALLGLTVFTGAGNRMSIYLSPFLGLGFGYAMHIMLSYIFEKINFRSNLRELIIGLITVIFLIPANVFFYIPKPMFSDELYEALKDIKPQDRYRASFWTWWDYGYLIEYTSRVGTYVDNGNFEPKKLYLFAKSMLTSEESTAYKIISFVDTNHFRNVRSLENLYEKAVKYKGEPDREIYVLITNEMTRMRVIYDIGKKDLKETPVWFFTKCLSKDRINYNCLLLRFNIKDISFDGDKKIVDRILTYKRILLVDKDSQRITILNSNKNGKERIALLIKHKEELFYMDVSEVLFNSMMFKLYLGVEDFKHFEKIKDNFPAFVIYKVK